jgi:hypothetical protein
MTKFNVGDKVGYHSLFSGKPVEATVDKVSTSDGISEYEEPLYHISWPPTGIAYARESQLSRLHQEEL